MAGAGSKSDLIVFEALTTVDTDLGVTEVWTPAFSVWAEFQPVGSREFPVLTKRVVETTARFIIWYREGISPATHRILARGKTWNISDPLHDRKRHETTIEASEIA